MFFTVTKYLLTAGVIVLLSELAKRSDKMGALVAVMPIVKIIVLIGRGIENQPEKQQTIPGTHSGGFCLRWRYFCCSPM